MEKDTLIDPSDEDVNTHNDFDVNVYKITFSDSINIYNVMFYRKENKLLRYYGACYGTEAAYNIAYCKWINDSTVTIKLHNSRNKKEKMFSVSGKGGTSTLIIEKTK